MSVPPPSAPPDEDSRVAALHAAEILDTLPEQAYDDLTVLAGQVCATPIAQLALIDADRQWYKSAIGTSIGGSARSVAFCARAIARPDEVFVVEDAKLDPRFFDNPFVTADPHLRFYAGAPIVVAGGHAIGTLCVIDTEPRTLNDVQRHCLQALARQAAVLLDLRAQAIAAERLAAAHEKQSVEARLKKHRGVELLELILRGGHMGLWDLHVPTGVWTVNAREHVMLGYAGNDAPAGPLDWRSLVHPDDRELLADAMKPHLDGRASFYECTHRMRHADGHDLWVLDRGVVVERDVRGDAVRIVGTHVDVTESRQRADEQRHAAERLELALCGGDHGWWDWHVPTGAVVRDRTWMKIHGVPGRPAETIDGGYAIDALWRSVADDDDRERAQAGMARHLQGLTPSFEAEMRMRHRDGRVQWMLYRAKVFERDADGNAVRVVGTSMDITGRKNDEVALERARALLARIGRLARVGGWTLDLATEAVTWSDEVYRIHEVDPPETFDLERALAFLRPEARPLLQAALAECRTAGTPWDLELPLTTARGRGIWVRMFGVAEFEDGRVTRLFGTVQDITDRKLVDLRRIDDEQRLRGILDHVPAMIAELDIEGRFRFVNETYRSWLGVDPASMIGRHLSAVTSSDYYAGRRDYLVRAGCGEKVSFEQTLSLPIGTRCLQTTYLPHRDGAGVVVGIDSLTNDITELKEVQRKLDQMARIDPLTGLPNRRHFEERLAEAMARTRRHGVALAVLYLDIDRFKAVNDAHGHAGGDAVLIEVGRRLAGNVRETDLVARHAGDEFVVLLEGISGPEEAQAVATKLVAAMRPPFEVTGQPIDVTTSVGVATFAGGPSEAPALLQRADRALYEAKARGRDCVSVAEAG